MKVSVIQIALSIANKLDAFRKNMEFSSKHRDMRFSPQQITADGPQINRGHYAML